MHREVKNHGFYQVPCLEFNFNDLIGLQFVFKSTEASWLPSDEVPKLPLDLVPDAWVVSEQLQQVGYSVQSLGCAGETPQPLNVIFLRLCQAVLGAATSCGLRGRTLVSCRMRHVFVGLIANRLLSYPLWMGFP